ncbi:hypothetical protein ACEN2S_07790 [Phaeovulum sp. W22_SRMD_FR3]
MKTIETERLSLRHFRERDAEALFNHLQRTVANCFVSLTLRDREAALADVSLSHFDIVHVKMTCIMSS